jgi:hypothetical protein
MARLSRHFGAALFAIVCLGTVLAGCGGDNPYQTAAKATASSVVGNSVVRNSVVGNGSSVVGNNDFLPNRNISDCVGTMERPNCGSRTKGGYQMYATFAALLLGMAFIGWRISIGVRARDRVVNAED